MVRIILQNTTKLLLHKHTVTIQNPGPTISTW